MKMSLVVISFGNNLICFQKWSRQRIVPFSVSPSSVTRKMVPRNPTLIDLSRNTPKSFIMLRNCINVTNHKNYNFLGFDWFKKGLFSTNSLAKLLSDSLLLDSLLSDSSKSQSHSKM